MLDCKHRQQYQIDQNCLAETNLGTGIQGLGNYKIANKSNGIEKG